MVDYEWTSRAWAQAWQLTALIVVVAIASRLLARRRPHLAYVLWLVVLAKCLTPPVIASPAGIFCRLQSWLAEWSESDAPGNDKAHRQLDAVAWSQPLNGPDREGLHSVESEADETIGSDHLPISLARMAEEEVWNSRLERIDDPFHEGVEQRTRSPFLWLGPAWLMGTVFVLVVAGGRTLICLRRLNRAGIESRPELQTLLAELRDRLRIRVRVRLIVTHSSLGPAVVGLFRPTIVLPAIVATTRSERELEAILTHELIHIRRGDLWTGLVQVLAQGVWWFHPLVWLANRRTTRVSEACCDQETITELGCDPAAYAESLLDIVAISNQLVPIPAFPGVRPVDITRERLERIMQIGQGSPKHTPWWCWVAMSLVAAATLPGAAIVAQSAAGEDPKVPVDSAQQDRIVESPPSPSVFLPEGNVDPQSDKAATPTDDASPGDVQVTPQVDASTDTVEPTTSRRLIHWKFRQSPDANSDIGNPRILLQAERLERLKSLEDEDKSVVKAEGFVRVEAGSVSVFADKAVIRLRVRESSRVVDKVALELSGRVRWSSPQFRLSAERIVASLEPRSNGGETEVVLQSLSAKAAGVEGQGGGADQVRSDSLVRLVLFARPRDAGKPAMPDPRALQLTAQSLEITRGRTPRHSEGEQLKLHLEGQIQLQAGNLHIGSDTCQFAVPDRRPSADQKSASLSRLAASFAGHVILRTSVPPGSTALVQGEITAAADRMTLLPVIAQSAERTVCLQAALLLEGNATFLHDDREIAANSMRIELAAKYPDPNSPQQPLSATGQMELTGDVKIRSRSAGETGQVLLGDRIQFNAAKVAAQIERAALVEPIRVQSLAANSLDRRISLHVEDELLSEALKILSKELQLNIAIRPEGLEEAGVSQETRTSINVKDIPAREALIQILDPLKLIATFRNDVLVITSRAAFSRESELVTITYPVADIVIPVQDLRVNLSTKNESSVSKSNQDPEFSKLIELITSTIQPESWDDLGGPGSVREWQASLSLVVRQTHTVHDEVANLLGQLRRLQDLETKLELTALRIPASFQPDFKLPLESLDVRGALMTEVEVASLRKAAKENSRASLQDLPNCSLLNRQGLEMNVPQFGRDAPALQLVPIISPTRNCIRLSLAVGAKDSIDAMSRASTFVIPADQALLVDVTDELKSTPIANLRPAQIGAIRRKMKKDSGDRYLLLITPRIPPAEHEERIGH